MSRVTYNFDKVERFILGTVGLPGERQFYLQLRDAGRILSFALEKGQAQALTDRFNEILKEAKFQRSQAVLDNAPLDTPIDSEFELGVMSISWKFDSDRIIFEAQGLRSSNSDDLVEELITNDDEAAPPLLRVQLLPEQVASFIRRANSVIKAGRQPCMFCGGPINLDGHFCPRAN